MGQDNTVPRRINKVEGAAGEVMVSSGPGVVESWGAQPTAGIWTFAETLSPAGVATITSSNFAAHDLWQIIVDVQLLNAGETDLCLRINAQAGAIYAHRYLTGAGLAEAGGQNEIIIGSTLLNVGATVGTLLIAGKPKGTGVTEFLGVVGNIVSGYASIKSLLTAVCNLAADLQSVTIFARVGNMTGTIKIYHRDY